MASRFMKTMLCAGTLFLLATAANATTWRLSTKLPPDSPEGKLHQKFADLVSEYTKGEVKIQIYPSEQLGNAQSVLEQVGAGVIDIFSDDVTYLDKFDPAVSWISAPFLFDSREHWSCFLKSDYFQGILDHVKEDNHIGVIGDVGPFIRGPFRVLVSKEKVNGFKDIDNLKLRLWDNQMIVDVWSALGAEARVLAWTDVYQSIQTGIVDAVTSPASLVESMKFTEVAPHIARTDEFNQALVYMINTNSWNAITPEQQQEVLKAYNEVGKISQETTARITDESIARLEAKGVTYVELDTAPFVEATKAVYKKFEESGKLPAGFLDAVDKVRGACN